MAKWSQKNPERLSGICTSGSQHVQQQFKGRGRIPKGLQLPRPEPDERSPGKQKLEMTFELPPGSYATILVRRLLLA